MEPIPPIRARRELAGNRFFSLVEEDLPDRHGRDYTYHAVESKWDAVLVVPVLDDGRLVVERIYRHPYRRWFHEFPAGGIEPGEDPVAAGGRELREETGRTAARLTPLTSYEVMPGLLRMRLHIVLAEGLSAPAATEHEAMEMIRVLEMSEGDCWQAASEQPASSFLTLGLMAYAARERLGVTSRSA